MPNLLEIKNLKTHFVSKKNTVPAVDGVSLSIKQGETVAIVGESGCGKSITSLSIMQLVPEPNGEIVGGTILFNGKNLLECTEEEMCHVRGKDVSMIFQDPMTSLNPVLTIGEQLMEVVVHHQKKSKQAAYERAISLLKMVGFSNPEDIMKNYPHRLSGGMRQRVMIAMAMICNPSLLIADEPTTALDVTIQAQIIELMKELNDQYATSILLITHDLGIVSEMAEKVVVMYAGQVVEEASVEELFSNALHPYTEGLIRSIPVMEGERKELYSIPGNVPSPEDFPDHCRFATRCSKAFARCFQGQPNLIQQTETQFVRCFLYEE
ncbi:MULTISPECIES: ABC transporter ATP-binding protein [Clostridia]|uniref:ABC transporter ATP-binding protein n=1 Tax=Clostridia TaxID=186801 RepID=UPI000EA0AD4D|nr:MULTISPECIES: ABC transporter ATP-binding protein [Clostridia]NBJ69289.1 ABC transporter ATP-binding protein [Roseburia sp. 1XD42-34]RKI79254.1 ABC transporter ATP-binding protein [Clostridium sp. 1xD42-85]